MASGSNQPSKAFNNSGAGYNSSKNFKNQTTHTNNRYSSQNMKSFEYEDDNEENEAGEVADENCNLT